MRVLWFTDVLPTAARRHLGMPAEPGPQAWVEGLAAALRAVPDLELTIACPSPEPCEPFEADGTGYVCLSVLPPASRVGRIVSGWGHPLTPETLLADAVDLVRDRRPDIVHVHGAEGAFGALAPRIAPVPCVISLQGIVQLYQRVYFAGRTPAEMARMVASTEFLKGRGLMHEYLLMRRKAVREVRVMRDARWFIGRTAWDEGVAAALNPRACYFHCDEIMRAAFYGPTWSPLERAEPVIYSTSSSMLFKGTEVLLEALAVLRRQDGLRPRIRVSGIPPGSELETLYRRAAARWGVEDAVDWLGRVDAAQIIAELCAADAFAYPSHIDNSPNALVEAMLVGAPCVAACTGGIPSLLADGEEGLLFPRGDAVGLAAGLARLLEDKAAAAALGRAAQARALRRNDPAAIASRTAAIYEEIVGATRGTGRLARRSEQAAGR